jgi:hypothetical protein
MNYLNGIIFFAYLLAGILTVVISYLIIAWYKKDLLHLMNNGKSDNQNDNLLKTIYRQIELRNIKSQNKISPKAQLVKSIKWQTFTVYLMAYLAYILIYSILDLQNTKIEHSVYRIAFLILIISPPLCLLYIHIFIADQNIELKLLFTICGISIILITIWAFLFSDETPNIFDGIRLFATYNAIPLILIFLFRLRKIKGVSLTLSIFSFITILISSLIISFFSFNDNALRIITNLLYNAGFKGTSMKLVFFLLLILIGSLVAWQTLRIFKKFNNKHQITPLQLFADAYLLIFGLFHASLSASEGNSAYIVYFCSFLAYKFVAILLFRLLSKKEETNSKLLYLRVFDLGEKTENLFKAIETEWRYAGPIQLITGPDLAHSTVEPHEIITYLAGNLKESFSTNKSKVEQNLSNIYLKPLLDNSYQTNEMFCDNGHWKDVLVGLLKNTDIVLMDLRSFDKKYAGCSYEIKQLCYLLDLSKCLFIVDNNTNRPFLENIFIDCFAELPYDSPNAKKEVTTVNCFELNTLNDESSFEIFQLLVELGD